jgi:hypothetical protein
VADFEEGPCGSAGCYTDWSYMQAEDPSLAVTTLNAVVRATKVGIVAHRGRFVGQFATTSADASFTPF